MRSRRTRFGALLTTVALVASLTVVMLTSGVASAGTAVVTNACFSNATATYSDLAFTFTGTDSPDPATLGVDNVTISSAVFGADVPADLLIAGYNLGLLTVGVNVIPATVYVARAASGAATDVDVQNFVINGTTTITDPDGVAGTGDESATPISLSIPLADWTVTPSSGGTISWAQAGPGTLPTIPGVGAGGASVTPAGSVFISASVAGGLIKANFDCQAGTTDPLDDTSFTPATPAAFETTTVNAPPAPPVANDDGPGAGAWGNASVGGLQSRTLSVLANDTDQNGDIDCTTVTVVTPPTGGTTSVDTAAGPDCGKITYTNTDASVGTDTFQYTVSDLGGNGPSNIATVTISVLGNQCDATAGACSLNQTIILPVTGTTMTLDQAGTEVLMVGTLDPAGGPDGIPGNTDDCVIPDPIGPDGIPGTGDETFGVVLNGDAQTACGALNELTVTNARGTDAGWSLTGEVTDFSDGTVAGNTCPANDPSTWNNHCIPGDNLGWVPSSAIAHTVVLGDVAQVVDGADAFDPLTQIRVGAPSPGSPTGLGPAAAGGLTLCSSPDNHSGGTFTCGAGLLLSVPASSAAGTYVGTLTLTLA